ncbi:3287_t:CDS:2 [Acaulospora colombiana]|uniref:3287_t:CDS:1 n=1 Tax=Acaulospora colombiana TaxID=27376 RepID=A0ACA9NH45_9GLOM|nr:3287_t:CDS:2 [Acaulospora colombiana]
MDTSSYELKHCEGCGRKFRIPPGASLAICKRNTGHEQEQRSASPAQEDATHYLFVVETSPQSESREPPRPAIKKFKIRRVEPSSSPLITSSLHHSPNMHENPVDLSTSDIASPNGDTGQMDRPQRVEQSFHCVVDGTPLYVSPLSRFERNLKPPLQRFAEGHAHHLLGIKQSGRPDLWPSIDSATYGDVGTTSRESITVSGPLRVDWAQPSLTDWTKRLASLLPINGHTPRATAKEKKKRQDRLWKARLRTVSEYRVPEDASKALNILGPKGMSSDESEGEPGTRDRQYWTKTPEWRSPELTSWLRSLDALPSSIFQVQTLNLPRTRLPTESQSTRRPPPNLPESFFRREWLESQSSSSRSTLRTTKGSIDLPNLSPGILVRATDSSSSPSSTTPEL